MDEGFQLVEAALHRAVVWEPGSVDREKRPRLVPIGLNDKLLWRRAAAVIRLHIGSDAHAGGGAGNVEPARPYCLARLQELPLC